MSWSHYMWHLSPKNQYYPRHFPAYQCTLNVNMNRNQAFCVAVVIFLLQSISIRQQQMVAFVILYMRWINSYQAMLNIAMIRRRNRTLRRQRIAPYAWSIPHPAKSWFEITTQLCHKNTFGSSYESTRTLLISSVIFSTGEL